MCSPLGSILHAPLLKRVPEGYMTLEGQSLLRRDYPELFKIIGTIYGGHCWNRMCQGHHFNIPFINRSYMIRVKEMSV